MVMNIPGLAPEKYTLARPSNNVNYKPNLSSERLTNALLSKEDLKKCRNIGDRSQMGA
jgi:hypothetical protein